MEKTDIKRAAEALKGGELVVFPTETVYGLGANALDPKAVARIFEAKDRPRFNPLIVHVADLEGLAGIVDVEKEATRLAKLASRFWPGPLTLLLPKKEAVSDLVTAGLPHVAVRIPKHPIAQALLREAGVPVAAPSANLSSELSPTRLADVSAAIQAKARVSLDGGDTEVGLESTILALTPSGGEILRPGVITSQDIEAVIGPVTASTSTTPEAPGMLLKHYSPKTRTLPWRGEKISAKKSGILAFSHVPQGDWAASQVLSETGDLSEAAQHLFRALHRLDDAGLELLYVEAVPEEGIGIAINDRLRRAAFAG